ncbi:MAG: ferrous iron transport protein B [Desulfovibrionaceae bacterium]|jgi:ferrous iron transport protein B|nr:ferrous iron transport protein B [Desulfovibrionaceae bacterium]
MAATERAQPTIALAGQPNTGKSTVFNALTGLRQAVGNWSGKTVEKKSGTLHAPSGPRLVVDLPGTYSLTAASAEERIARDFVMDEGPDLVVVVVNAACLERTLYYVSELAVLGAPFVVALNMMDVAREEGARVDPVRLAERLGVPVVPMVASRGRGVDDLRRVIEARLAELRDGREPGGPDGPDGPDGTDRTDGARAPGDADASGRGVVWLADDLRATHRDLARLLGNGDGATRRAGWEALKLMEGDPEVVARVAARGPATQERVRARLDGADGLFARLADARYAWIRSLTGDAGGAPGETGAVHGAEQSRTRRWDRWATHAFWGPLIMAGVLLVALAVGGLLGFPLVILMVKGMFAVEQVVFGLGNEILPWLGGLLQGLVRGVGSVLAILPFLMAFYAVFGVLEDVGYMARVAFLMDRFMSRIGLSGKSFIPLLFSLPCNITGVMAARIAESERQRTLTTLLIPLVPCSAKIAVSAAIASWLFPPAVAVGAVLGLLALNFLLLALASTVFDRFLLPGDRDRRFILELPHYHRPDWRTVGRYVLRRGRSFVRKAATIIVAFSVLVWFASYYPTGEITTSLLGRLGRQLGPVGELMGLDWRMMTSLLASVLNKEALLATMGIIFDVPQQALPGAVRAVTDTAGAVAFMCAQSLFLPCVATLGTLRSETGNGLRTILVIVGYTAALSLGTGIAVYHLVGLFA